MFCRYLGFNKNVDIKFSADDAQVRAKSKDLKAKYFKSVWEG